MNSPKTKKSLKWSPTTRSPPNRRGKYLNHKTKSGKTATPEQSEYYYRTCRQAFPKPRCDNIRRSYQTRKDETSRKQQIRCGQIYACGDITLPPPYLKSDSDSSTETVTPKRKSPPIIINVDVTPKRKSPPKRTVSPSKRTLTKKKSPTRKSPPKKQKTKEERDRDFQVFMKMVADRKRKRTDVIDLTNE
jgi:hypothetical protein